MANLIDLIMDVKAWISILMLPSEQGFMLVFRDNAESFLNSTFAV